MEDDQETQSNQVASDADEPKIHADTTEILGNNYRRGRNRRRRNH